MPLQLALAVEPDFEAIMSLFFIAYTPYSDPREPYIDLICPGHNPATDPGYQQGLQDATQRWLARWKATKSEHWLKVVDPSEGKIVGASRWRIRDNDHLAGGTPVVSIPYLEGRTREYAEFVEQARADLYASQCRGPHILLCNCFTHPDYRLQGAGSLMMQWAIDKADDMNCDCYVEANIHGEKLYQKFGFIPIEGIHHPRKMNADREWRELEDKWPLIFQWMKRPKR